MIERDGPPQEDERERKYRELFSWRPTIPSGVKAIYNTILDRLDNSSESTEPGYAWERLPRWLEEVKEIFSKTSDKPIMCIDVCSSVPLYAQYLRASQFVRDRRRAQEIEASFYNEATNKSLKKDKPAIFQEITTSLSRAKDGSRDLLATAIHEIIYEITYDEAYAADEDDLEVFRQRVKEKLCSQNYNYEEDNTTDDIESSWRFRFDIVEQPKTYLERVAELPVRTERAAVSSKLLAVNRRLSAAAFQQYALTTREHEPIGAELAEAFVDWQVEHLLKHIVGNPRHRPSRYVSMDISEPEDIARSSLVHTPETTQQLRMFSYAINSLFEPNQHIKGNVFEELPFPDESVTLITCFDGWPFHFQLDEGLHGEHQDFGQVTVDVIEGWYNKLVPGGKIVLFPWAIQSENRTEEKANHRILEGAYTELLKRLKIGIIRQGFHKETLYDWMSPSDRETAETLSPIFQSYHEYFDALIIEKPRASLLKYREKAGRMAINRVQSQGSQDPTP